MAIGLATRRQTLRLLAASSIAGLGSMPSSAWGRDPVGKWEPLFSGNDSLAWTFFQEGVGQVDRDHAVTRDRHRTITFLGDDYIGGLQPGNGHIATTQEYSRFHLKLEFKWGSRRYAPADLRKRNSGLVFHLAPDRDRPWPDGVELNIQEGDVGDMIGTNTRALQGATHSGSFVWPPEKTATDYAPTKTDGITRQFLRKDGDFEHLDGWNAIDLIVMDDEAAFIVNGRIVNVIYGIQRLVDAPSKTYASLTGGRIALQIQSAEIAFRNTRIRQLT